uniref:Uncharacterized protein n=1 Tax=Anopheles quadriannulatus TaxID=34691 RepID=A0A182XRP9_ANOQN
MASTWLIKRASVKMKTTQLIYSPLMPPTPLSGLEMRG